MREGPTRPLRDSSLMQVFPIRTVLILFPSPEWRHKPLILRLIGLKKAALIAAFFFLLTPGQGGGTGHSSR